MKWLQTRMKFTDVLLAKPKEEINSMRSSQPQLCTSILQANLTVSSQPYYELYTKSCGNRTNSKPRCPGGYVQINYNAVNYAANFLHEDSKKVNRLKLYWMIRKQ
jgi:hypothetical protein